MNRAPLRLTSLGDFWWQARSCERSLRIVRQKMQQGTYPDSMPEFFDLGETTPCSGYTALLRRAKVVADAKLVATADDVVAGDVQFLFGSDDPERHWLLRQRRLRIPRALTGRSALISGSNGENYYHWLFDSLPRLQMLQWAGYSLDQIDHFVLNSSWPSFQLQSLQAFGIGDDRLYFASKRDIVECETLLVPSMPGPLGLSPKWVCDFVHRQFVPQPVDRPRRRVYISRALAPGRRVQNEPQILPLLARHGFEVVHAEKLSFEQQVALFSSAQIVVAVHGAGLSNLVFAPAGARALELRSPTHTNECFRSVARHRGLDYHTLVMESGPTRNTVAGSGRYGDVVLQVPEFERKLEELVG